MSGIRVLYSFPLRVGVPGIGATAWHQVSALTAIGAEVVLSCGSLERPIQGLSPRLETLKHVGIKVPMRAFGTRRAARLHDLLTARALASGRLDVDAVHGWPLGSLETLRVARTLGIPTFLERPNAHTAVAYDLVLDEYRRLGLEQPKSITHHYDRRRLAVELQEYQETDFLLCPSDFVASTFAMSGFDQRRLLRTQYGFDPEVYYPAEGNRGNGLTVVFAGTCEPRKGLHFALDAWLASVASRTGRLVICGSFTPGYFELLESRLAHPSVQVMGYCASLAEALRDSDALVLPSIEEGSALVTYEAMASGSVPLVSNAAGAPVGHMVEALVHQSGDWRALGEHLDLINGDREVLSRLRANALDSATRLTWHCAAERLLAVYGTPPT